MSKKISTCLGLIFVLLFVTVSPVFANTNEGNTGAPVVNDSYTNQKNYVDLRFGMFIHYNMGTYHDQEWVTPGQDPLSFNPEHVNTDQWAQAAKSAGIKYSVLTTKHHDGFALWPTKYGDYNVMNSSYKKDIVRQYVDSMRAQGILPGIYFSIWDRQEGIAKGSISRADIEFIKGQLTELLTNYGEIPVLIIDGWAWQMGHNEVPYQEIRELVKSLQPNVLIVDHNGQTQPWEEDIIYFEEPKGVWAPSNNMLAANQGMPLVSNQWFWHNWMRNTEPASVKNIVEDHLGYLEPRYTNFLLNISPNPDGELDDNVVNRLAEIGQAWTPNESRPPLPQQPIVMEHTITANSATATSGNASNAIDGLMDYVGTYVESVWQSSTSLPQSITLDLGYTYNNINMLNYLPSQSVSEGMITSYTLYVSEDGTNFTSVKSGTWNEDNSMKRVTFPSHTARYFKLEVNSAVGGFAAAGELAVGSFTNEVPTRTGIDSFDVNTLYRIVNKATGKLLGVGNSLTNGAAVAGRTQSGALDQQWVIDDLGLGKYKIVNKHSGQVMDVSGASISPGKPVIQWTDSETTADPTVINQQWAISNVGNGYFKITSVNSQLALENSNGSDADGNPVVQNKYTGSDSQLWKVESQPSLIKNVKVNGVLVKGLNAENRSAILTVLREKNLEVPTVTVDKATEDVQLVIDPADSLPGATTITAIADGGATQEVYTLNFELVDRYASDLKWLNASSGWSTVKKDKSLDGNAIRLMGSKGSVSYEKGYGVHANSRIMFDISDKNYESFNALVGVDQEMAKSPSYADVEFKVLVDGVEKYASGQMKLTDVAKPVDVNVAGSSIVELVVTQSDGDNSEDHASWANATFRVAKGKPELKEKLPEVDYLSDIDWVSAESGWSTVKRDKSIDGNTIVLKNGDQDLSFGKGLGTHANSSIKYDLTGADYETFSAFIGVDKEVNGGSNNGSIQFKVLGMKNDDTIESLYSGIVMRESQNAQFVKVNVKGYKQLILEVTDSGNGNSEDHGDWADAKLTIGESIPILTQSIAVASASDSIGTKGGTLQLSATVLPADAMNKVVTWAVYEVDGTTATDNASISASGLLTAVKNGEVKVVATAVDGSGVIGSKVITISGQSDTPDPERVEVESIEVTSTSNTITAKSGTLQLGAIVLPEDATNKAVSWSVYETDETTATDKATISASGLLTAVKDGAVKVVATAVDGSNVVGSKIFTISGQSDTTEPDPVKVASITVTSEGNATTITTKGGTLQLGATVSPEDATNKAVTWLVQEADGTLATDKATISTSGWLTAMKDGAVKVVATAVDGSNVVGSKIFTISGQSDTTEPDPVKVATITVTSEGNATTITTKGGKLQLEAAVLPDNAANKAVIWSLYEADGTTATDKATISASGLLTAVKDGAVKVMATAVDGSNVVGSKIITISGQSDTTEPEPVKVAIITVTSEGNDTTIATKGGTLQLEAALLPDNAANKAVTWSLYEADGTTATDKATISTSGLLTAVKDGAVKVVATAVDGSNVVGSKIITISGQSDTTEPDPVKVATIRVTSEGNATTITTKGGKLQLEAAVLPDNAANKAVIWSLYEADGTTATDKATISTSGLLTAVKDGAVKVIATAVDGSNVVGSKIITISGQSDTTEPEPVKVAIITVTSEGNDTTIVTKGGTLQLEAAVLPDNAANKAVIWSLYEADGTTATDKATISTSGLLTAVKDGAVKVVATAADGSSVIGSKVITISSQSESGGNGNGGGNNGGGNNGGGGSTTEPSIGDPAVYESKGSELTVDTADNTVKAELNAEAFMKKVQAFEQAGDSAGSVLSIKVSGSYAGYDVAIPADAVNRLAGSKPNAVIEVTSPIGSYVWSVSELAGKDLDSNGRVIVRIEQADPAVQKGLKEKLAGSSTKIIGTVVSYEAGLKEKGSTTELAPAGYVERTLIVDSVVTNPNEATVVKYDPTTGELRFVPAVFTVKDGKTIATIQHNENGLYVILEGKKTFADMQGHWAQQAVEALASKLIVKGKTETTFDPNGQVTRAEFASLLVRSLGLSSKGSDQAFIDVAASSWYASDVSAAVQYEFVQGIGSNKFNPDAFITREQMAVMIMKAVQFVQGYARAEANESSVSLAAYSDVNQLSSFAREAVQAVIEAGIMNGKSETTIAPKETASRAQTAVMLKRALSFLKLINS